MSWHPLDGARLKVVRAEEHLDAFKAETASFLATKPYTFESSVTSSSALGEHWWIKPILTTPPPPRLSVLIGDCVTNLRASLDYIIWELAQKYFDPPVNVSLQGDRQILNFPILLADPSRRQGHLDHLRRLAKRGMPTGAIDIIKEVQADAGGDEQLRWLYDLVNTDTHRTPILTIASFVVAQIEITNFRGKNLLIRHDCIKDGVAIKAEPQELIDSIRDGHVDVNVQAAVDRSTPVSRW